MSLATAILTSPWAITPDAAAARMGLVARLLKGETNWPKLSEEEMQKHELRFVVPKSQAHGHPFRGRENNAEIEDMPFGTVAILPVKGEVTKADQFCGPVGTRSRINLLQRLDMAENIAGVVLEMETPGGEASALDEFFEATQNFSKPIMTWVDGYCYSAGMFMGAGTDGIYLSSPSAEVGSIGTMFTAVDVRGFFEKEGIKLEDIYAPQSTDKNGRFRAWIGGDTKPYEAWLSEFNQIFIAAVQEGRPAVKKDALTGKTFMGDKAIAVGLADGYATLGEVVQMVSEKSQEQRQAAAQTVMNKIKNEGKREAMNTLETILNKGLEALGMEYGQKAKDKDAPESGDSTESSADESQEDSTEEQSANGADATESPEGGSGEESQEETDGSGAEESEETEGAAAPSSVEQMTTAQIKERAAALRELTSATQEAAEATNKEAAAQERLAAAKSLDKSSVKGKKGDKSLAGPSSGKSSGPKSEEEFYEMVGEQFQGVLAPRLADDEEEEDDF